MKYIVIGAIIYILVFSIIFLIIYKNGGKSKLKISNEEYNDFLIYLEKQKQEKINKKIRK